MKELTNTDSKKWFVTVKGGTIHSYGELDVNQILSVSDECDVEVFDTREEWLVILSDKGIQEAITVVNTTVESRQSTIDRLTAAAENSGLSVPLEAFYYKYRKEVFDWVVNGGEILVDIFIADPAPWLDLRETEGSLSPREFALKILKP